MIKVCHITNVHQRYDLRILKKECVSLVRNGYNVSLLVQDDLKDEKYKGVNIISTGRKPDNRIDRIRSIRSLLNIAITCDADIYHIHDPELMLVGLKLKRLNKTVIFDSHEDIPIQISDKTYLPKFSRKFISGVYSFLEKKILSKYDGLITVTPHIANRLKNINANIEIITNYPIVDSINAKEVKSDNHCKLCFAGGITHQWNIDIIIKAIEHIDNVSLILAGPISSNYLGDLKQLKGWSKVKYLGKISHSEVKDIYLESDIGCALNYSLQLKNNGSLGNTKIFEFMASKLPVICTNYPIWDNLVKKSKCGVSIDPRSVDNVKQVIQELKNARKLRYEMGENGRNAVEREFNWSTQEKKLVDFYARMK